MSKFEMFLQRATEGELERAYDRQVKQSERVKDRMCIILERLNELRAEKVLIKEDSD